MKDNLMMTYVIAYLIAGVAFLAIDAVWLGVIAKNFYGAQLGDLMADDVKFGVAAVFYLLYAVGIVVFAIRPALASNDVMEAIIYAALFGFLAYGTYDFTNLSTIRDWPWVVTLVDVTWGTVLTIVAAVIGFYGTKAVQGS